MQNITIVNEASLDSILSGEIKLPALPMSKQHTERRKVGEVAGGAAAECAAICCCCPCAVVKFVVLAVYRVPAAVCKKAWKQSKRRRFVAKRHGLLEGSQSSVHAKLKEEDPTAEVIVFEESAVNDVMVLSRMKCWNGFMGRGFGEACRGGTRDDRTLFKKK